jgi:hypothetical protein
VLALNVLFFNFVSRTSKLGLKLTGFAKQHIFKFLMNSGLQLARAYKSYEKQNVAANEGKG